MRPDRQFLAESPETTPPPPRGSPLRCGHDGPPTTSLQILSPSPVPLPRCLVVKNGWKIAAHVARRYARSGVIDGQDDARPLDLRSHGHPRLGSAAAEARVGRVEDEVEHHLHKCLGVPSCNSWSRDPRRGRYPSLQLTPRDPERVASDRAELRVLGAESTPAQSRESAR